jgi:pimeloyl-ACP methyl ester carboxylesterase
VIAESGSGAFSIDWALVQPEVSKFTRFCSYDRAGYAWSDAGPTRDSVEETADDLHLLLQVAGVRPPYVLIGASLGGLYIRAYQRRYPNQIAGLIFDDATTEKSLGFPVGGKNTFITDISSRELHGAGSSAGALKVYYDRCARITASSHFVATPPCSPDGSVDNGLSWRWFWGRCSCCCCPFSVTGWNGTHF